MISGSIHAFFGAFIPLQAVPPSNGLDDHGYLRNRTNIENYNPKVPFESQGRPRSDFDPNATSIAGRSLTGIRVSLVHIVYEILNGPVERPQMILHEPQMGNLVKRGLLALALDNGTTELLDGFLGVARVIDGFTSLLVSGSFS